MIRIALNGNICKNKRIMETNDKKQCRYNLTGVWIMIGLAVLGLFIYSAASLMKSYDRTVYVRGLCERTVNADRVVWPISYKIIGDDLINLYDQMNHNNKVITDYLKGYGIAESDISVGVPNVVDLKADRYSSQDRVVARYNITAVITVISHDVDKVRKAIDGQTALLKKSIPLNTEDYRYNTNYFFDGLNSIKPQMVQEATANARETAEKFAADSKSKLGKIKTASQGQFSIESVDETTPYVKKVRVVTSVTYFLK